MLIEVTNAFVKKNNFAEAQVFRLGSITNVTLSVVSAWEIAIKKSLGKLEAPENLKESVAASGFQWLSVVYEHVWRVKDLPFHHEDPFDRLLIAQADIEDLTFVTRDSRIKAYSIPLLDT